MDFGFSEKAISVVTAAISKKPDDRQLRMTLACIYRDIGNYDAAIRCFKELARRCHYEPLGLVGEAECLRLQKRWHEADALVKRALTMFGAHPVVLIETIELLRAQRKFDEALKSCTDIQSAGEMGYRLAILRGAIYRAAGKKQEALSSFDEMTSQYPALPAVWIGRGDVLRDFQEYELAAAQYLEVIARWPHVGRARIALAAIRVAQGRFPEAEFLIGLKSESPSRQDWVREHIRCNILLRKLAYEEVIDKCTTALRSIEVVNVRVAFESLSALASLRMGRWEKAIESLRGVGSTFGSIIRLHAFAAARRVPEAVAELDAIGAQASEQERHLAHEIAAHYDVANFAATSSLNWVDTEEERLVLVQAA